MNDTRPSSLWLDLSQGPFKSISDGFLESFRRPNGANNRLGAWDATDPTARHFKFLLWNACETRDEHFFDTLSRIAPRDVGRPVSIRYRGMNVDMDYALAADECEFLGREGISPRTVVEVGAGFGRTAHAMLSVYDAIEQYVIVDLPEVLELSRRYLGRVLSAAALDRVRFCSALEQLPAGRFDLFINIDSFQEMRPEAIRAYEAGLMRTATHAYLKQPIGKYDPTEFEIAQATGRSDVFALGLSTEVFTVCDEDAYRAQLARHINHYLFEDTYELIASRRCPFFHYYHHLLIRHRKMAA
jgi:putative sugar O-methyltransferase